MFLVYRYGFDIEITLDDEFYLCFNDRCGDIVTKGQAEAKISEAVSKFEIEYMGRGPKQSPTLIIQDLIIIKLKGFLSQSEQKLAENKMRSGVAQKGSHRTILRKSREYLIGLIQEVVDVEVISTHSDVAAKSGRKIIVVTTAENLEDRFSR